MKMTISICRFDVAEMRPEFSVSWHELTQKVKLRTRSFVFKPPHSDGASFKKYGPDGLSRVVFQGGRMTSYTPPCENEANSSNIGASI